MTDNVLVTDDGAIRTIRMNRPEKKNALTRAMYDGITRALHEADSNDAIRCVLLAGAPGVFCAGNDISDFLNASEGGLDPRGHSFLKTLAGCQKPLVAAVGGLAVGVGTTMLLHCDHVVAARRSDVYDAIRKARAHSRGGLDPAGADAHGPCARVLAAGHGPPALRRGGQGRGHGQHGRRRLPPSTASR